jgi:FkbM family methyltransferase
MPNLIAALAQSPALRHAAVRLRLHRVANAWLRRFPRVRRLPGSGVVYRARWIESIPLAEDMFSKGQLYDASLLPPGFTSFADLGCNVGYFTCWLAHLAQGRRLRGLILDANPEALEEARWHLQANGLTDVVAVHGVVGEGPPGTHAEFYLYESNICSTSHLPDLEKMGLKGRWRPIRVPCVSVSQEWQRHLGATRCHVLKLDIEGSELSFLRTETEFMNLVDAALVEWHTWQAPLAQVQAQLAALGFSFVRVLEDHGDIGTAYFRRQN